MTSPNHALASHHAVLGDLYAVPATAQSATPHALVQSTPDTAAELRAQAEQESRLDALRHGLEMIRALDKQALRAGGRLPQTVVDNALAAFRARLAQPDTHEADERRQWLAQLESRRDGLY